MADLSDKEILDKWNKAGEQEKSDAEILDKWNRAGEPASPQPSGLLRRGGDIAISAVKGAISLPEAFVGLANIPTMGLAGKAAKGLGVDFKGSREFLDTMLSPEQQQLNREVQETEGFFPTVGAMIQRPSTIGHAVIESAPSMIGAGAIGRGILKVAPKIGAVVGGAVGEGAISAGQTVEQVRQTMPTGLIDPGQIAIGVTSGAITGLFGVLGGKLARRLGTFDPETLLAGGRLNVVRNAGELEAKKSILRKIIEAAITEGAFEELPQSAQEQIAQNLMLGKPPEEGVANAAATGMLAGTVMGGGAGVAGHILAKTNPVIEQLKTDPLDQEIGKQMSDLPQELEVVKVPPITPPAIPPALGLGGVPPVAPITPPVAPVAPVTEVTPASLAAKFNNLPVVEAPVPQITLSSEIPQHKRGANAKGIITPLEGKEYQRTPMKTIILWERNDGRLEVVTGRHRLDLAQRLGEKTIPSQIVREADGFTAEMGVALDAEQNILDNQGDEYDFANYFRTAITETDANDRGLLRTPKARTAFILAKSATDSTFDAFRDDAIGFEQAAAIAKSAPQNETLQLAGRNHVVKNPRISPFELENYVKVLSTFPPAPQAEQGDMFGYDDTAIRTAEMQAKKVVSIVNKMKADSQIINAAIRREGKLKLTPEAAAEYGIIDPNDMNQLTAARIKILNELDMWANWDQHPELVARLKGEEIAPIAPVAALPPVATPEVAPIVPPTPEAPVAPVEQPIAPVAEVSPAEIAPPAEAVPETKVETLPAPIVEPEPVVGANRWANDLAALDQEVATKRDTILRWSKNQAEADGWIDKWTPEKAIDEHYGKYVRGLGSASGIPLKQGETWRGRLVEMANREPGATAGGKQPWEMTAVEARRTFPTLTQEKWGDAVQAALDDGRLTENSAPFQSMYKAKPRDFGEIDAVINGRMSPSKELLERHPELAPVAEVSPVEEVSKQPWEMTREAYVASQMEAVGNDKTNPYYGAMQNYLTLARKELPKFRKSLEDKFSNEWYDATEKAAIEGKSVARKPNWMMTLEEFERVTGNAPEEHRMSIDAALTEGKPVPPKVLKDYPELQKEAYIGKVASEEIPGIPPPKAEPFGLTTPEGEVGKEGMVNREVTGELFGKAETKPGLINDIKATLHGVRISILRTWENKLEEFKNELQRTIRENRIGKIAPDTIDNRQHEVLLLGRLRDQRRVDTRIEKAVRDKDGHWDGVQYSPEFADSPEFGLAKQHFGNLGFDVVPISEVKWGGCVDIDDAGTQTVFLGVMEGWRFAFFMSHETSHILSAQGNDAVIALKKAIDLTHPLAVKQRKDFDWTDDYARDEFAASIVGGMASNEAMLTGDQTANIRAAREMATYTKYGDIKPPSTNQPASWLSPEDNWKATAFYKWFDRYNDLDASMKPIGEFLRNSGTILTDDQDPLLIVRQYKKKAADQERRFNSEEVEPQFKKLEEYNITQPEIDQYLWMRSAVDENKFLRERHQRDEAVREAKAVAAGKDFKPDLDFPADPAGVSDEKATAYMRNLKPQRKLQFEAVAKMYDAMIKKTRAVAVAGKLETQETMDQWAKDHPLYAPYFREGKEKETSVYQGIGQGFTNIGSISKGRIGSELAVFHPFANGIMQRARVMRRVEKNKADIALSGLVKIAPNAGWWKPAVPRIREMTLADGTRADVVDDTYKYDENVIMGRVPVKERVRIDGKMIDKWRIVEQGVEFNKDNPRALRLARALKNLDMEDQALILGIAAKITRFVSKVNTEWSPTFGPVNFTRDLGTMLMNLSTTPIAGKQKEVLKNIPGNLNAIYSELRARRSGGKSDHRLAAVYDQFQLDGGQMGLSEMFRSSNELAESIERRLAGGKSDKALRKAVRLSVSATFNWLSDFNKTLENAVRLSVYMVGLDSGMTGPRSANMANEITVDFTKKGQVAQQANALFAFFTASAGGGLRAYQTVMGPKGKQIIMGGILFGMLQTALLAAWGFEDDEPPDFIKERNIIIPTGWKTYKTIPMPLVFNVLPNIGRIFMEGSIAGFKGKPVHPVEKLATLMGVIVEACNPLGGSGVSLQTITPTPLDPLVALAENMDWNRQQISRPDFSSLSPTPGFTRAKDTASYIGMGLSWAFNMLSGGTQYTKGFFSPTPDQIDYLVGQASGGLGREMIKVQHIARAMRKGDEIPAYRIPFISRFHGSTEGQAQESTRFYNNLKLMNKHEDEITGRRDNRKPITEYLKDYPEARHFAMANRAESSIARLMKQKRALTERGASQSSIKVIDAAITSHMKRFNATIKKAKG